MGISFNTVPQTYCVLKSCWTCHGTVKASYPELDISWPSVIPVLLKRKRRTISDSLNIKKNVVVIL